MSYITNAEIEGYIGYSPDPFLLPKETFKLNDSEKLRKAYTDPDDVKMQNIYSQNDETIDKAVDDTIGKKITSLIGGLIPKKEYIGDQSGNSVEKSLFYVFVFIVVLIFIYLQIQTARNLHKIYKVLKKNRN